MPPTQSTSNDSAVKATTHVSKNSTTYVHLLSTPKSLLFQSLRQTLSNTTPGLEFHHETSAIRSSRCHPPRATPPSPHHTSVSPAERSQTAQTPPSSHAAAAKAHATATQRVRKRIKPPTNPIATPSSTFCSPSDPPGSRATSLCAPRPPQKSLNPLTPCSTCACGRLALAAPRVFGIWAFRSTLMR